jgi:hypothetical protein
MLAYEFDSEVLANLKLAEEAALLLVLVVFECSEEASLDSALVGVVVGKLVEKLAVFVGLANGSKEEAKKE